MPDPSQGYTFYYQQNPKQYQEASANSQTQNTNQQVSQQSTQDDAAAREEQIRQEKIRTAIKKGYNSTITSGLNREDQQLVNDYLAYGGRYKGESGIYKQRGVKSSTASPSSQPTPAEQAAGQSLLPEYRDSGYKPVASGVRGGVIFQNTLGQQQEFTPVASSTTGGVIYAPTQSLNTGSQSRGYGAGYSVSSGGSDGLSDSYSSSNSNRIYSSQDNPEKTSTQNFLSGYISPIRNAFSSPKNALTTVAVGGAIIGLGFVAPEIAAVAGIGAVGYQGYKFISSPSYTGAGELAFAVTPIVAGGALKGISYLRGFPRSSSLVLERSTQIASTEEGYTAQSTGFVQTTQKGLLGNRNFISMVETRTFYQFEGENFVARSGALGVTTENRGINFPTGKTVYSKPTKFGSVAATEGRITQPAINPETQGFISRSAIKTQVQGGKSAYYGSVQGGVQVSEEYVVSAGRSAQYRNGGFLRQNRGVYGGITKLETNPEDISYSYISKSGGLKGARPSINALEESNLANIAASSTPRSGLRFGQSSAAFTIARTTQVRSQSPYYGQGTYERTESVSYNRPMGRTLSVQIDQTLIREGQVSRTGLSQGTAQRTNYRQIFYIQQAYGQPSRTQERSAFAFAFANVQAQRSASRNRTPPFVPVVQLYSPNRTPFVPSKKLYILGDLGVNNYPARRVTQYTPSYSALVFKIGGSYRAGRLSKSGLDFRPVTRGFSISRRRRL